MLQTRVVIDWAVAEHKAREEEKSVIDLYAKWSERRHNDYKPRIKIEYTVI